MSNHTQDSIKAVTYYEFIEEIPTVDHATKLWTENRDSKLKSIAYVKEALSQSDIEEWERKEYKMVLEDYQLELEHAERMIKVCEEVS